MKVDFKKFGSVAKASVVKFIKEEDGVTAIEYGLLAGLIAIAIVGAVTAMSGGLSNLFNAVCTKLNTAASSAATC